ncbi:MAG: hypothetical protein NC311_06615 [Muribaculaceae bacterium]|nr:hypothetical protein [Muribaculaceae bacterium]
MGYFYEATLPDFPKVTFYARAYTGADTPVEIDDFAGVLTTAIAESTVDFAGNYKACLDDNCRRYIALYGSKMIGTTETMYRLYVELCPDNAAPVRHGRLAEYYELVHGPDLDP